MRNYIFLALLLIAACVPTIPSAPTPTGFMPQQRGDPTATAVPWVEGSTAITLENVARIRRLGRLDTPNTPSTVFAYAFSPDGTRLAGINNDQMLAWNLLTGSTVLNTARLDAQWIFYAPDKTELYTLDVDGGIRVHDADTGVEKDRLAGQLQFGSVTAYAPDDGWLALGGSNGEVKVWDVAARQSLVTIQAHAAPVGALAFSPDGERLATGAQDGKVYVWDWRDKQAVASIEGNALRLAFSPDGTQLAVGQNAFIELWHVADGSRAYRLPTGPGGSRDVLLYAPDGRYLINGGGIPAMMVWNVRAGTLINNLPNVGGESTSAAFSPDGKLLVTSVLGGPVTLWNMSQITQTALSRADLDFGVPQALYVDWSPDGFLLTIFEAAGPVQVWGIEKQSP
jgi:WD40 repeat protein